MEKKFILCPARHDHPEIAGLPAIFPQEIAEITDIAGMTRTAREAIADCDGIDLYVTGLTVAVGAVIRACYTSMKALTLWHYDRAKDAYFPQVIMTAEDVGLMREGGWYW